MLAAHLTAQTVRSEPPFQPLFPSSLAVGDALVASAQGFDSLFSNPAGFARGKPSFTLATAAAGLFAPPTATNFDLLRTAWSSPATAAKTLGPLFDGGGFGASSAVGIGYTGSGLGLGLVASSEMWGAAATDMQATTTVAFIGGMGFNIGKHLVVGGDVRPMFRVRVPTAPIGDLLTFVQNPTSAGSGVASLYGVAVGLDLGAITTFGPFSFGLAVTDIGGTNFYYAQDSLGALALSLQSGGGLPAGQAVSGSYVVPMQATAGVAYHPDLGRTSTFFDPRFEIDYAYRFDPNAGQVASSTLLLDGLHAGVDVGLLSFLHLRAGYQFGRVSAGVGMTLPGFQIDTEGFQQVVPTVHTGPTEGVSAAISIRF